MTFGTTHSVSVFAISPEMKHRRSLLAAASEVARITDRLLAICLMLYTAILLLTFFLGIFLWGRTVKAESAVITSGLASSTVSNFTCAPLMRQFSWEPKSPTRPPPRSTDFRHYSPLTSLETMSPSYPGRYTSTNPRGIEQ
jgi:hypothetical protein